MEDSDNKHQDQLARAEGQKQDRIVRFNGEITFGHILTILSMLGAMVSLWHNLDTRLTVLETQFAHISADLTWVYKPIK